MARWPFVQAINTFLPPSYYLLIKSCLTDRHFQIQYGSALSDVAAINAGAHQGGILSPVLNNILPQHISSGLL